MQRDTYSGATGAVLRNFVSKAIASAELGIASVEVEGTTITFTFEDDTTATMTFPTPADGEDGADGVSIVDVDIDANKHLICTLSDGNTVDAGALPMPSLSNYYTKQQTDEKFNPKNNFKTINGNSIIGTGDIPVSGGGGGTEVVANPELSGDEADLGGLKIGNAKYKVPSGGSNVVVNPILSGDEETATSIKVGDEKYVFPVVNTYGFTSSQITMFEGILRAGTYSSDQSSAITAFIESLSESPEPTPKVLTSITAVLNNPTVEQGQAYTPNATVTAHYDDSSSAVVTSGVSYSTIDTSTTGEKTLTISYTENEVTKSTTATVTVTAEPVPKTLSNISSVLTGTYNTNNSISDVTSHITTTATYSDSTTATVTGTYDTSGVTMSTAGTYSIGVSYSEGGVTKTTTVSLTVSQASGGEVIYTKSELVCAVTTDGQKFGDSHTPWVQGSDYKYEFDYEITALEEGSAVNVRDANAMHQFEITSTLGATGHIEDTITSNYTRERQAFVCKNTGYTIKLTNITITKLS